MAKNKREIDLKVKQEELESTAARLFLTLGYDGTSMSRIARELGVAPNTLYWYYPSKDELLVAVLNRQMSATLARLPGIAGLPLKDKMAWALQAFEQSRELVTTVHARLEQSAVIREWHEQFHHFVEAAVIHTLEAEGVAPARAAMLATVGTFLVEGLLAHPHSEAQREAILQWFAVSALPD
ncbi:MAG: TetR/AcrR family transcriptional regulator [Alcanivoracaceae bacterium]|uniref:TetR/AcrR family transcriptional regulator n=1 Tax=Alcanivorax profundi TaxID=2338368 RepID=A0A418XYT1_9GAMM|nr:MULTISPECIES: TetR/AcrR family transcriptional regulator [Alcanivorax]MAX56281.1 TetR/AcrR family transcriptional regulator [Alcanivoracaceae bacterium]MCG8438544.1 TetR/AcrR family transcriptional regulator [Pseudomonadales bacterium]MED5433045.1 helix-turn-helix domain-containing protein [Pseudomonadota bacterium]ERP91504.1 TetR family transcriptional regulator [Alcanivorax sp. P2S70]MEE2870669.1 helix-turn-helix domain-containing protein [Pseudomonadota bacterium]